MQYSVTTDDDGAPSDVGVSAVMVLLPFLAFMLLSLMANLLPSLILVAFLPLVSTTLVVNVNLLTDKNTCDVDNSGKFSASVVDTCGKFVVAEGAP